jgi:hypothetical protein
MSDAARQLHMNKHAQKQHALTANSDAYARCLMQLAVAIAGMALAEKAPYGSFPGHSVSVSPAGPASEHARVHASVLDVVLLVIRSAQRDEIVGFVP